MKVSRHYIIAALIASLSVLTSCRQELCYDHYPTVDIQFGWEHEWERDYGLYHFDDWDAEHYGVSYDELRPTPPEWISMLRYTDDRVPVQNFLKPEGASFIVEENKPFSVLFYNGDTEYIVLSDVASLNDARASATSRSRSSLKIMYEIFKDARSTNPPDVLYSAFIENIPGVNNHERKKFQIKMQPLVYTYVIEYEFEYGLDKVALARGAIGGMAESVFLRTGVTSERTSIILYDCDIKATGCQANVRSFGIPGFPDIYYGRTESTTPDRPFSLNLEVMLRNGKTLEFNFDISDQMKNQPRGGVIKVSGLRIEDDQSEPSSGFDVDVSDWNDQGDIIDLPLDMK